MEEVARMKDPYAWWLAVLAGENPEIHEDEPQPGFYRIRDKGQLLPVAIWWHGETDEAGEPEGDQKLVCLIGQEEVDPLGLWGQEKSSNPMSVWLRAAKSPVTEEAYRMALESGRWPDDAPEPARGSVMGDNLPENPVERILAEIAGEEEIVEEFLAKPVEAQEEADKVGPWAKRIGDIAKRAEDLRVAEKQPFLDGGRAVDEKWRLPIAKATELAKKLKAHLKPFLDKKDREERERRAKAEAQARELREKAAKKKSDAEREELERQAAEAESDAVERNASAGRTGARVSLRREKRARVIDYEKAALALLKSGNQDLKEKIDQLAQRAARAGLKIDGVEIEEVTKAA
jgi:hypothetical protein